MKKTLFVVWVLFVSILSGCAGPSRLASVSVEPPNRGIYHEVQKRETLWQIAQSYRISVDEITAANKLQDSSRISPGQLLFVPTSAGRPTPSSSLPSPLPGKIPSGALHFGWPVRGTVAAAFGEKTPLGKNKGINFSAKEGSPVLASAPGRVSFAGEKLKGFGKTIILEHTQQFQTVYAHNQELLVRPGDVVQQRQPIARIGQTGRVQQPTLHFEIRQRNRPLNPMEVLSRQ